MKRGLVLLLLCVFFAGVFVGIWLDWSAWKRSVGTHNIVFEVQDYPMANLQVHGGDTVELVPPPGGNPSGLAMNFIGYSPCTSGQNPANPCTIDSGASAGPYLFTCNSSAGYSCPDPGVQQSPTGPMEDLSYGRFVERDFAHLLGVHRPARQGQTPPATPGTHPAASAITAYVSCPNPMGPTQPTALQDPNGNSLTTINATKGESVFWISAKPFNLDTSKFPANLCSNGNPPSGSTQEAQCDIQLSGQTVPYSVQAQTCSATSATLITQ
jgi:hypothetical protein